MKESDLPRFLYLDCDNKITIGYHGGSDITEEWNKFLEDFETEKIKKLKEEIRDLKILLKHS